MRPKCGECGTGFERRTTWQKFCSVLCRLRNNRKRLRAEKAEADDKEKAS